MPYGVRNTWWINRINTRKTGVNLVLSLLLLSTFVYASFIEPNNIQVRNVEIRTNKVYDEVTILHISDIQSVHIGKYEQKVFEIIEHLNPDLILHTGDLLQTGLNAEMIKLARLFKQLRPKYGIYNVVGDTDSQMNWQKFHRLSGVKTLIDKNVLINDKKVKISILGLSLHKSRYRDKSLIEDWKCRSKKDEFTIVFGHAPDYISKILKLDIDMCLAGHTHGGQVNIPFWGPVVTFSRFPKKWSNGFIKIRNSHVNVSAGIGVERACNLPPIRFNCPPVMTLFALRPQKITTD